MWKRHDWTGNKWADWDVDLRRDDLELERWQPSYAVFGDPQTDDFVLCLDIQDGVYITVWEWVP